MSLEVEAKYMDQDFDKLKKRLASCQAQYLGCVFEENLVFDSIDPSKSLLASKTLLRLRTISSNQGQSYLLTLKLKVPDSANCKIRDEREVFVTDGKSMEGILQGLGYQVVAKYEKMRSTWQLLNVEVCLDTLPFGQYVELEGAEADILACAQALQLDHAMSTTKSYHDLHQDWLRQNHPNDAKTLSQVSFVFAPDIKASLWQEVHTIE